MQSHRVIILINKTSPYIFDVSSPINIINSNYLIQSKLHNAGKTPKKFRGTRCFRKSRSGSFRIIMINNNYNNKNKNNDNDNNHNHNVMRRILKMMRNLTGRQWKLIGRGRR